MHCLQPLISLTFQLAYCVRPRHIIHFSLKCKSSSSIMRFTSVFAILVLNNEGEIPTIHSVNGCLPFSAKRFLEVKIVRTRLSFYLFFSVKMKLRPRKSDTKLTISDPLLHWQLIEWMNEWGKKNVFSTGDNFFLPVATCATSTFCTAVAPFVLFFFYVCLLCFSQFPHRTSLCLRFIFYVLHMY